MQATALLISSAMLHALWNAIVKRDADSRTTLMGVLIVAAAAASFAMPFFQARAFGNAEGMFWTLGAGLCEGGYMITLAMALERSSLGLAYMIMRGGAMVVVWLVSIILLTEPFGPYALVGVGAVLIGMAITNKESTKRFSLKALKPAYACALFIAGYHLCYGQALRLFVHPVALFAMAMWVSVPIYIFFCGSKTFRSLQAKVRKDPFPLVFGGILSALSFIVFLIGLENAGAGYAITLRNTSIIFAQIFALFIGEKVSTKQWIGALLITAGVSCLSLQ